MIFQEEYLVQYSEEKSSLFSLLNYKYTEGMKLDTESKMSFDRTVSTEERFALRKWFDQFVELQNNHDLVEFNSMLSDALIVDGFTDITLYKQSYLDFLKPIIFDQESSQARYPKLNFSYQGFLFHASGDFEIYLDGVLACEGEISFEIKKTDDKFEVVRKKFSPRMMLAFDF